MPKDWQTLTYGRIRTFRGLLTGNIMINVYKYGEHAKITLFLLKPQSPLKFCFVIEKE